jgi:exonuclease III
MADSRLFRVMSYNCRGFNVHKIAHIRSFLSKTDILFLQEHWLSEDQLRLLGDIDPQFVFAGVSGLGNNEILSGRPCGGCAILWRSSLSASFEILPASSRRICALRMSSEEIKLLFVTVYMPYEGDEAMTADFADQLNEIENLVSNNNDCHVIIDGDFNVDFSRDRLHTAMLDSFCDNTGLNPIVRHAKCSIDYS